MTYVFLHMCFCSLSDAQILKYNLWMFEKFQISGKLQNPISVVGIIAKSRNTNKFAGIFLILSNRFLLIFMHSFFHYILYRSHCFNFPYVRLLGSFYIDSTVKVKEFLKLGPNAVIKAVLYGCDAKNLALL